MLSLQGYYDGTAVQTLGKITPKKNQKLIITILDEFYRGNTEELLPEVHWKICQYSIMGEGRNSLGESGR